MPNHVTNKLRIFATDTMGILDFIKGDENHPLIDFNKIVPMPESLNIESGSRGEMGYFLLTGEEPPKRYHFFDRTETYRKQAANLSEKEREECLALGRQYKENVEKYGHTTWYDWAVENWGTKWNAYEQDELDDGVQFDTAWSTPVPIFKALSAKFPDARIEVEYADEDLGNNCGRLIFNGGDLISQMEGDLRFACEVKGCDYDEIVTEYEED